MGFFKFIARAKTVLFASFLFAANVAQATTITLDFEDGALPSASGWQNFVGESGTTWSVVPGQATGQGGSNILRSVGTDNYGWVFDLDGLIAPEADWSFVADIRRVASVGFGMFNDIGLLKYGSNEKGVTIGTLTDTLWHRFEISYDAMTGTHSAAIDGTAVPTFTPLPGNNQNLPAGTNEAISFGFGNVGVTKTVEWDNISFTFENPAVAPVPLSGSAAFLMLGLAALGMRRRANP